LSSSLQSAEDGGAAIPGVDPSTLIFPDAGLSLQDVRDIAGRSPATPCNLQEMASLLRTSVVTMRNWMRRYGDEFPILERGNNGRPWQLDPVAVKLFIQRKWAEEGQAEAARTAELEQLRMPGLDDTDPVPAGMKPSDLYAMEKVRQMRRREAIENGHLVPTTEVRMQLMPQIARLGRGLSALIDQVARKHALVEAVRRDWQAGCRELQERFVGEVQSFGATKDDGQSSLI
jgi:hypothetical protein